MRDAIKFIHDGGIGKVYMARGLCFKPRPSIGKYPDGPMQPGEQYKLNVDGDDVRADRTTPPYLSKVDYDLWLGPAPKRPFNRNRFHYNWHWHWDYGNGDTGNQGPHQFDIARWGLQQAGAPGEGQLDGRLLRRASRRRKRRTCRRRCSSTPTARSSSSARAASFTNDEGGVRIGNLFYGTKGWLWIEEAGRTWQSYLGPEEREGAGRRRRPTRRSEPTGLTTTEFPHYQNFIDAIRANDPKMLTCDILEGHLSSTLPHLAQHLVPRRPRS